MKKKVSKKKVGIISTVLVAICIVGGIALTSNSTDEEFSEPLREYSVSRGDIIAGFTGSGQLKLNSKDYNFDEPVTIDEIFVKVGQHIKAGDSLAKISEESIQKQLEDLNEQLTKANITLEQANNTKQLNILNNEKSWKQVTQTSQEQYNNSKSSIESELKKLDEQMDHLKQQINEIQNKINELEANQVQVNNELDNQESTEENVHTITTVDDELSQLKQQLVELKQQEEALQTHINEVIVRKNDLDWNRNKEIEKEKQEAKSNKEINDKTLQDMDASIKLATMEVKKIQKEISKIKELSKNNILVSDVDGIVKELGYTPNTVTTIDKAIVTIGVLDDITAELSVSQNDVTKLEEGQVVHLEVNAFPGEKVTAKVKSINYMPTADGGTVSYKVIVELDPNNRNLLEGMTVNAKFILKEVKDVLILSNKAIILKDGKQMVQVKREGGTIEEVEITTGFSDGRVSEIKDGLNEGDVVVVGG